MPLTTTTVLAIVATTLAGGLVGSFLPSLFILIGLPGWLGVIAAFPAGIFIGHVGFKLFPQ